MTKCRREELRVCFAIILAIAIVGAMCFGVEKFKEHRRASSQDFDQTAGEVVLTADEQIQFQLEQLQWKAEQMDRDAAERAQQHQSALNEIEIASARSRVEALRVFVANKEAMQAAQAETIYLKRQAIAQIQANQQAQMADQQARHETQMAQLAQQQAQLEAQQRAAAKEQQQPPVYHDDLWERNRNEFQRLKHERNVRNGWMIPAQTPR